MFDIEHLLTERHSLFLGLGRLSQAEEYLSQAMWTVTKMPECSNAIKSKLYRNFGLLHAAKAEYDEALRHLADDVSIEMNYWTFKENSVLF